MACLGYKSHGDEDGPARCVTFCCPNCVNMHFCPTTPAMKTYQREHGIARVAAGRSADHQVVDAEARLAISAV